MGSNKLTFGIVIFISAIMLIPAVPYQNAFANGGFQGDFDPVNWTLIQNGGNGFVVTNAPASIELHGADFPTVDLEPQCENLVTLYQIEILEDGTIGFDWL